MQATFPNLDAHVAQAQPVAVRPAFLNDPRKERTISLAVLLNAPLHSATFPDAPSTARD